MPLRDHPIIRGAPITNSNRPFEARDIPVSSARYFHSRDVAAIMVVDWDARRVRSGRSGDRWTRRKSLENA
jgi:hypothetical protein